MSRVTPDGFCSAGIANINGDSIAITAHLNLLRRRNDDATVVLQRKICVRGAGTRFALMRAMPSPQVIRRIESIEEQVNTLNELPIRVGALETQIVGMRGDMTILQRDITTLQKDVTDLQTDVRDLRRDVTDLQRDVKELRVEMNLLRGEVREGDEETRRQMRVLHKEVISRIALLQEGQPRRRKRR